MSIDDRHFLHVIGATPLVAIDLIVRNTEGQVLLGWRRNRPAQHCWFVPGGRIRKNERLSQALARIARTELGTDVVTGQVLGVYEHFYPDNFIGAEGVDTHYVVIGYECRLPADAVPRPDDQHARLEWWDIEALLASADVHENTKRYLLPDENGDFRCR